MAGNIAIFVPHSGCPRQCSFCNQHTISGQQQPPTPQAVAETCRQALADLQERVGQVEIAFFGGSFTAIPRPIMTGLLAAVQPFRSHPRVAGIRISTRPDAIDTEVLSLLKDSGVTAIELGAQSMDDQVLALNQRGHTAAQVEEAARMIQSAGFALGLQMMTGLYGATQESDYATGERLAALSPDTMRIYPTVVLAGTHLAQRVIEGRYQPPGVEQSLPLLVRLMTLFEEKQIAVIRLGLHSSQLVAEQLVGGCYHPALGELVQGQRYLEQLLAQAATIEGKKLHLRLHPKKISQVLGQHKRNLAQLEQIGYNISYQADAAVGDAPFVLEKGE